MSASIDERAEGLTVQHYRRLLLNQEEKELVHKLSRKPTTATGDRTFSKALGPRPRALSNATIESSRCSSQCANLVSLLPLMLSTRVGSSYSSPASLDAFIFQRAFCFLGLLWLLHSHSPAHFFVSLIHLSPIISFDAFLQRLTEGIPVVINQGEKPTLFFYVVDIDVCLQRTLPLLSSTIHPSFP